MTQLPARTRLRPGQSLRMIGKTGMTILNLKGKVRVLSAPEWLGDQVWQCQMSLHEGDAYQVKRGGWIEIVACDDAEVIAIPAAGSDASMMERITSLLRKWLDRWIRSGKTRIS